MPWSLRGASPAPAILNFSSVSKALAQNRFTTAPQHSLLQCTKKCLDAPGSPSHTLDTLRCNSLSRVKPPSGAASDLLRNEEANGHDPHHRTQACGEAESGFRRRDSSSQ